MVMGVMESIRWRRSIRRYRPDPVDQEAVRLVLEAATLAPSGQNAQPWDFVVVTDPGTRFKLAEFLFGAHRKYFGEARVDAVAGADLDARLNRYTGLAQAPVFIVVCLHRKRRVMKQDYDADAYLWDVLSVGAAMENLIIAASSLGLGTIWLGTPNLQEGSLKELLGLPEDVKIAGVTPLGYPDESPKSRPRDPLEQVVHRDRW